MTAPALRDTLELLAARDWEGAHAIVQDNPAALASWAHGIVHLIEGDESNAGYWYQLAQRPYPGLQAIDAEIEALRAALDAAP